MPIESKREQWLLVRFLDEHDLPWAEHHLKDPAGQKGQLRRFKEWDKLILDEINQYSIENWRNKRLAANASPGTINRNVVVIRAVLSKAVEWGFLRYHPLAGLKKLSVDRSLAPQTLSDEDRTTFFIVLADRDQKLTGERRSANLWRQERHYPLLPRLTYFSDHLTPIVMTA